jgi:DNA-binding winged helix-turn-helix (wHTH) protein
MLIHSVFLSQTPSGPAEHLAALRPHRSFRFGPFVLQPERQLLLKFDAPVRIGGRALDLLTLLVERAGELVSKQDLMSRAWPDTFVEEGNLKVNIAGLRRALGQGRDVPGFIATVVGRGYRFVAPVESPLPYQRSM